MTAFMHIVGLVKETLRKILLRGEFDEYPDQKSMHCTARLVEKLNSYSKRINECPQSNHTLNFLMDEIIVLEEAKWIGLPNFMPRTAFLDILQKKVSGIAYMPIAFVDDVWNYLGKVLNDVLNRHSENYYQLQKVSSRAGENLIARMRENSKTHVNEAIQMEKLTDYTCNPDYMTEYNRLMAQADAFMKEIWHNENQPSTANLDGIGQVEIGHLRQYAHVMNQAFDLKMRMVAYWKIVLRRLVDTIALHMQLSISNLVNKELEKEISHEVLSPNRFGIERLLEESPSIAGKRHKLMRSVKVLKESKEVVTNIMDRISSYGD
ncbi:dynamin-related protein 4C-like [Senna tora]|uniref:Dynamin-related protein 4C-like n=1 Tax=Senna tora TaxID=362788 RepID=A0A834X8T8_9FABA|nr:dynamin-related protein 4C-like [Senna tora]